MNGISKNVCQSSWLREFSLLFFHPGSLFSQSLPFLSVRSIFYQVYFDLKLFSWFISLFYGGGPKNGFYRNPVSFLFFVKMIFEMFMFFISSETSLLNDRSYQKGQKQSINLILFQFFFENHVKIRKINFIGYQFVVDGIKLKYRFLREFFLLLFAHAVWIWNFYQPKRFLCNTKIFSIKSIS